MQYPVQSALLGVGPRWDPTRGDAQEDPAWDLVEIMLFTTNGSESNMVFLWVQKTSSCRCPFPETGFLYVLGLWIGMLWVPYEQPQERVWTCAHMFVGQTVRDV